MENDRASKYLSSNLGFRLNCSTFISLTGILQGSGLISLDTKTWSNLSFLGKAIYVPCQIIAIYLPMFNFLFIYFIKETLHHTVSHINNIFLVTHMEWNHIKWIY